MKQTQLLARITALFAIVALLGAGCAPIPVGPQPATSPTSAVFLPGVAAAPGALTSPLQPTAVITGTTAPLPTPPLTPTSWEPTATPLPTLVGPTWEWVSSTFKDGTVLAPGDPSRYTFQLLGDGNALVQADCNFGTGTYEESGASISFGAIGTTKMACPPDSMDSAFLAQLKNAATFTLEGENAVLSLEDEAGTMQLRPVPGPASAATPETLAPAASPTPLPTDTPWPATAQPPAPPATPTALPPPLPTPAPVLIGTPVALPTSVAAGGGALPALAGTSWALTGLIANGQTIPPIGDTPVTLEVDPNGARISGTTGCNLYRAILNGEASGATIMGPALMTQKACAANLMVQEVEFIDSLLRTHSYIVSGNELTLLDTGGQTLLVFAKK